MSTPRRRKLLSAALLSLTLALGGCGTLIDCFGEKRRGRREREGLRDFKDIYGGEVRIYGGIRWDFEFMTSGDIGPMLLLTIVDFPLSLVLDTLFFPATLIINLSDD